MQDETEKIIEEYILKTPESVRNFIASGEWKNNANSIADRFKFTEENKNNLKNEIIFVLIGMEPKSDFAENIKRELGIDSNMAGWIAEDVNKNIFGQVSAEIDSMWQMTRQEEPSNFAEATLDKKETPPQTTNSVGLAPQSESGVGNSFEQIILNQAKAMRPVRLVDESGRVTSYEARDTNKIPENLPVEQSQPKAIHNYVPGADPYRESIE